MTKKVFINLPVKDLEASKAFYTALGYGLETRFTDETAACIVVSETIYVMLLTHAKFTQFTPQPVAEEGVTEVMLCVTEDSRETVDIIADKALAAGGREIGPADDYGFMYGRNFADLDGHFWQVMWLDMTQMDAARAD